MNTTKEYYGDGVDTTKFTPERMDEFGNPIACLKYLGKTNYGLIGSNGMRIHPTLIHFCKFCAEHIGPEKTYSFNRADYPVSFEDGFVCATNKTHLLKEYGVDLRCVYNGGLSLNVNLVHPKDDNIWRPTMRISSDKGEMASKNGVAIIHTPSNIYWEAVIKGENLGKYSNTNHYFKLHSATSGDGRTITVENSDGNHNIFYRINEDMLIINSYSKGKDKRFFFATPSNMETSNGIAAPHNGESNKFYFKIGIYKIEEYKVGPAKGNVWRGSNMTRGENVTRGGKMAKGSAYSGGSNFEAEGNSDYVKTESLNGKKILLEEVNFTLQLVNNQSEAELVQNTVNIQRQITESREEEIKKLIKERDTLNDRIMELHNLQKITSGSMIEREKVITLETQSKFLL